LACTITQAQEFAWQCLHSGINRPTSGRRSSAIAAALSSCGRGSRRRGSRFLLPILIPIRHAQACGVNCFAFGNVRQHTMSYVSIRCRTSAYDVTYDIVYDIAYYIVYDIVYVYYSVYNICIRYHIRYRIRWSSVVFSGRPRMPRDLAQGPCPGACLGHFTQHIAYNIVYYVIVYYVVYDIINDMLCTCNTPSSIPLGGNEKLSCRTKIGAVKLCDRPRGGLHTWLVRRQCLSRWTTTTAIF
jgi:hypothetical protein